jgi:hypothetical protein
VINQTPIGLCSVGLMSVLARFVAQSRFQRQHSILLFVAKYTPIDFPSLFSTEPRMWYDWSRNIRSGTTSFTSSSCVIVYEVSLDLRCWKGVSEGQN